MLKTSLKQTVLAVLGVVYADVALAADTPAPAAPVAPANIQEAITMGKPMTNFRLRYEHVDQDGKTETADAWTLRSLIGWQTKEFNHFSVAAQLINVAQFNNSFYDNSETARGLATPADKANYPVVGDPDYTGINQLFLEWTGLPDTKFRLGRQSVKLDNVRFIGNVEFRQLMQVFDGIAVENKSIPNVDIYAAHFEGLRRITGVYYSNDNVDIAHATWKYTPTESLTGYGYFQDMPLNGYNTGSAYAGTGFANNSNRTLGLRADGSHKINDDWKVLYTAEYAKQDDYRGGNTLIDAHYWRLGAGAGWGNWSARLDREVLSSNNGLYGFQTPLATGHLFQGLGDFFLTTPAQGIKDTFVTVNGKVMEVQLSAEYHWLDADTRYTSNGVANGGNNYGQELDLVAGYSYNKNWSGKIEYFDFREGDALATRKRDTDKFLLTLMYSF